MLEFWTGSAELPIWGFLIRAVIVYFYIFIMIKVLGQRSIGAIHPLDFLFGVIIGDVLGEPLSSGDIPMAGSVTAAATIAGLHLFFSYIALKTPRFRRVIEDEPIILIEKGKILKQQLQKTKITIDSLMMDLRLSNAADLSEVDYAILESNGRISVIKKQMNIGVTRQDMNIANVMPKGYPTVLVVDGHVIKKNVAKVGTLDWLQKKIEDQGYEKPEDILFMTVDESGSIYTTPNV